jgi:hypothetical protein
LCDRATSTIIFESQFDRVNAPHQSYLNRIRD